MMELKHTEYGDCVIFADKKDLESFAREVAEHTSDKYTTIVFMDGTISHVTGSWTARRPVWVSFNGQFSAAQVAEHLLLAYETPDGETSPYTEKGERDC